MFGPGILLVLFVMIFTAAASFAAGIYLITRLNKDEPATVAAPTAD